MADVQSQKAATSRESSKKKKRREDPHTRKAREGLIFPPKGRASQVRKKPGSMVSNQVLNF